MDETTVAICIIGAIGIGIMIVMYSEMWWERRRQRRQ